MWIALLTPPLIIIFALAMERLEATAARPERRTAGPAPARIRPRRWVLSLRVRRPAPAAPVLRLPAA